MRRLLVAIIVALPAAAFAQSIPASLQCKSTETQAECHARLHCRADEEVEACQKRLAATANDDRTGREQRESDDRSGREQRGDDRGRDDRRGDDRDDDRGGRDDRSYRDDDRGRRGGGRDRSSRRRQGGGGGGFEANKTFGLGLELGEPSGLTGKLFVSPQAALDFGIGYAYQNYYYDDGLHIYADFLFHPTVLAHADAFELPFYIGGGIRYWDFDFCDPQGLCTYRGSAVGIRIPIGIDFDFNRAPIDIFLQIVPVIDFLHGDYYDRYRDRTHLAVDPSVGFRFWFK
jgi:hypothetical protein